VSVRPLIESDIPQVTDLYWKYMRGRSEPTPPGLQLLLRELYFTNPWLKGGTVPSLVYEGTGGRILGFLGVIAREMSVCGEPIRVAFGGNFVVHPEARSGVAAPGLLKAYMAGGGDILQTDSANEKWRRLLERMGWQTIPALNIHWARPLRPGSYAVHALSRSVGPALSAGLKLSKPFCRLVDSVAAGLPINPFRPVKPALQGAELDHLTLLQCLVEYREGYALWPKYDAESLRWLLNYMERRAARGNLRRVVVRDENQKPIGWYIYYVKPGAVGEVVQVGGELKRTKDILGHLFYDAWEHGVIALYGVVDSRRVPDFSQKGCFFTCRGGWTIAYSRKPQFLELLERGDAFLSRLDGEWCLDPGE
jgi:hypothetical protein